MKQINIHNIRTDGGTQSRVSLNQDVVNEYAELMAEGVRFPALAVYHDGSDYWLVDGFHRYFALKKNGASVVEVSATTGTLREAQLKSKAVNHDHGLRRTSADIHKAIKDMLTDDEWSKWSLGEIAKWVGTSKTTIHRVKGLLEPQTEQPAEEKQTTKFMRGGVEIEMDLAQVKGLNNQKRAERPVGTKPDSSTIDETKLENQQLTDQISELSDTIMSLTDENTLLRDKIAIGQWNASEIEKMDIEDTVKELREQIRLLEIDNKSLREGRDTYQNRVNELIRANKALQNRLKMYADA